MKNRIVMVCGEDLTELADCLMKASGILAAEGEDEEKIRRWAYACGKNYWTVVREKNKIVDKTEAMADCQEFREYLAEINTVLGEAAKDENGNVQMMRNEAGQEVPAVPAAKVPEVRLKVAAINQKHPIALSIQAEKVRERPLGFHVFDWSEVPKRILGAYTAFLSRFMIEGVPADFEVEFENRDERHDCG